MDAVYYEGPDSSDPVKLDEIQIDIYNDLVENYGMPERDAIVIAYHLDRVDVESRTVPDWGGIFTGVRGFAEITGISPTLISQRSWNLGYPSYRASLSERIGPNRVRKFWTAARARYLNANPALQ